jgi:carboxymethylenebutenolidase
VTSSRILISTGDGVFRAYAAGIAESATSGLVVLQEMYGVNEGMRRACDHFAAAGYYAICPDLYWRQQPEVELSDGSEAEVDKAFSLMARFDLEKAISDIRAAIASAVTAGCSSVGVVGYCLGGLLAFLAVCRTEAACGVAYYPSEIDKHLDEIPAIKRPLMVHLADFDRTTTADATTRVKVALSRSSFTTVHSYPADHAFARVGTKYFAFNKDLAELANLRTLEFLRRSNLLPRAALKP